MPSTSSPITAASTLRRARLRNPCGWRIAQCGWARPPPEPLERKHGGRIAHMPIGDMRLDRQEVHGRPRVQRRNPPALSCHRLSLQWILLIERSNSGDPALSSSWDRRQRRASPLSRKSPAWPRPETLWIEDARSIRQFDAFAKASDDRAQVGQMEGFIELRASGDRSGGSAVTSNKPRPAGMTRAGRLPAQPMVFARRASSAK